jgi:hypothetical protein
MLRFGCRLVHPLSLLREPDDLLSQHELLVPVPGHEELRLVDRS